MLGVLTPQALLGKVGLGGRIAQGYTITQVGKGSYDTTTKIIDGKMDWSNPWSYVETVATFAPLLGPIAKQLGKIGAVENAWNSVSQKAAPYLTKATSAAENIWGNVTQKCRVGTAHEQTLCGAITSAYSFDRSSRLDRDR